MKNKKPKVVFTFVEAGYGHIVPMSGMLEAFKKKYSDKCEIVKWNIFSSSENEQIRNYGLGLSNYSKKIMSSVIYKKLEGLSYLLSSKITLKFLDRHFKKEKVLIMDEIAKMQPDLLVASYYSPAHFAIEANKNKLTDCLVATYTPDPYVYPAWDRRTDIYLVNNDKANYLAHKKGFKNNVKQVPFIFKEGLLDINLTKSEAQKLLGLDNKFTVIFSSGAYGSSQTYNSVKELVKSNLNINIVAVCGKDEKLLSDIAKLKDENNKNISLYPIGFTDKLQQYFIASDVMIGKSGMNTIIEALIADTYVIINSSANCLEEKIGQWLVKDEKVAVKIYNPKKIVKKISELMANPQILEKHKQKCNKFKDNTGAEKGADELFNLLTTKFPELKS